MRHNEADGEDGELIKGTVLRMLYLGIAVFIALCAVLYLMQERLIFLRQPLPDSVRHATRELPDTTEIELRADDGTRLHGWLRHSPQATPPHGLLIYFGGNAEEISGHIHDAQAFAPWSVAAFNYRGYGRSEGRPSETALVADALVIHDHLARREDIDPTRIVAFGRSLGS